MEKIFISGSISIKKLPDKAVEKLASIMEKGYEVLIGDAGGVDSRVQEILSNNGYSRVMVYHVGNQPRHNVGNWQTRSIISQNRLKGRALYTLKDQAMAADASYGMMVWDGKSQGTFNNMLEMRRLNKQFLIIRNGEEIRGSSIERLLQEKQAEQLELFPFSPTLGSSIVLP